MSPCPWWRSCSPTGALPGPRWRLPVVVVTGVMAASSLIGVVAARASGGGAGHQSARRGLPGHRVAPRARPRVAAGRSPGKRHPGGRVHRRPVPARRRDRARAGQVAAGGRRALRTAAPAVIHRRQRPVRLLAARYARDGKPRAGAAERRRGGDALPPLRHRPADQPHDRVGGGDGGPRRRVRRRRRRLPGDPRPADGAEHLRRRRLHARRVRPVPAGTTTRPARRRPALRPRPIRRAGAPAPVPDRAGALAALGTRGLGDRDRDGRRGRRPLRSTPSRSKGVARCS